MAAYYGQKEGEREGLKTTREWPEQPGGEGAQTTNEWPGEKSLDGFDWESWVSESNLKPEGLARVLARELKSLETLFKMTDKGIREFAEDDLQMKREIDRERLIDAVRASQKRNDKGPPKVVYLSQNDPDLQRKIEGFWMNRDNVKPIIISPDEVAQRATMKKTEKEMEKMIAFHEDCVRVIKDGLKALKISSQMLDSASIDPKTGQFEREALVKKTVSEIESRWVQIKQRISQRPAQMTPSFSHQPVKKKHTVKKAPGPASPSSAKVASSFWHQQEKKKHTVNKGPPPFSPPPPQMASSFSHQSVKKNHAVNKAPRPASPPPAQMASSFWHQQEKKKHTVNTAPRPASPPPRPQLSPRKFPVRQSNPITEKQVKSVPVRQVKSPVAKSSKIDHGTSTQVIRSKDDEKEPNPSQSKKVTPQSPSKTPSRPWWKKKKKEKQIKSIPYSLELSSKSRYHKNTYEALVNEDFSGPECAWTDDKKYQSISAILPRESTVKYIRLSGRSDYINGSEIQVLSGIHDWVKVADTPTFEKWDKRIMKIPVDRDTKVVRVYRKDGGDFALACYHLSVWGHSV